MMQVLASQFMVAKKMGTCRFYQNTLLVSSKSTWEKMTRSKANGLKFEHKCENNLVSSACSLKDVNICFFKRFQTAMHSCKLDIRHLFCYSELRFVAAEKAVLPLSWLSYCIKIGGHV